MKTEPINILLIEDEKPEIYASELESKQFKVIIAHTGSEGVAKFKESNVDSILLDLRLPDLHGFEVLKQIREIDPLVPVFVITAYGDQQTIADSFKRGAVEFLPKGSINWDEVAQLIHQQVEKRKIEIEASQFKQRFERENTLLPNTIIGESLRMKEVFSILYRIAEQEVTVLIQGESGTGKELVARILHQQSLRKDQPFFAVNCAAIPETLLEAELFGYERGAFTGAIDSRPGKFEVASKGTLFLDEVGDLSSSAQAKLLRVLENKEFTHLGSNHILKTDARIIAATAKNLEEAVKQKTFREELYYRLNVITISLPPLRERKEDIPLLCEYALKNYNQMYKKKVTQISPETMSYLLKHDWPGNVRELFHTIERGVILTRTKVLTPDTIPNKIKSAESNLTMLDLNHVIKTHITRVLKAVANNRSQAAKILKIDRKRLTRLIKKFNIAI